MSTERRGRPKIDRDQVHELLFSRANPHGYLKFSPKAYALEWGISAEVMYNIIGEFEDEGRIESVQRGKRQKIVLLIHDPKIWKWERSNPPTD